MKGARVRLETGCDDNGMLGTIVRYQRATIAVQKDGVDVRLYAYSYDAVIRIDGKELDAN